MEKLKFQLPIAQSSLPTRRENSSVKEALADRLTLPEALDAISRMIGGYPQKAQDSYLAAIAETLMHYPKSVALACADPFHGVVLQSPDFLPSQSRVIEWCEKRCRSLYEQRASEDRRARQLSDRELWRSDPHDPHFLAKLQSWLDRSDPVARELIERGGGAEENKRHEAALTYLQKANRRIFEHECARCGVDPAAGVSPSLLAVLSALKITEAKE